MAKIPEFTSSKTPSLPNIRSGLRTDPFYSNLIQTNDAKFNKIVNEAKELQRQIEAVDNSVEQSRKRHDTRLKLDEIKQRAFEDEDTSEEAQQKYMDEMDAVLDDASGEFDGPESAKFIASMQSTLTSHHLEIRSKTRDKIIQKGKIEVENSYESAMGQWVNSEGVAGRAAALDAYKHDLSNFVNSNVITSAQANEMISSFEEMAPIMTAKNDITTKPYEEVIAKLEANEYGINDTTSDSGEVKTQDAWLRELSRDALAEKGRKDEVNRVLQKEKMNQQYLAYQEDWLQNPQDYTADKIEELIINEEIPEDLGRQWIRAVNKSYLNGSTEAEFEAQFWNDQFKHDPFKLFDPDTGNFNALTREQHLDKLTDIRTKLMEMHANGVISKDKLNQYTGAFSALIQAADKKIIKGRTIQEIYKYYEEHDAKSAFGEFMEKWTGIGALGASAAAGQFTTVTVESIGRGYKNIWQHARDVLQDNFNIKNPQRAMVDPDLAGKLSLKEGLTIFENDPLKVTTAKHYQIKDGKPTRIK